MAVFAVAVAAGDIIKYQSFVYGSFVWGIHVRYNNLYYYTSREFHIQNFHRRTTDIYNITRCYSDGEYCHSIAKAAGDIVNSNTPRL